MSFKSQIHNTQIDFQALEESRLFSQDLKLSDQIKNLSKPSDNSLNIKSNAINKLSRKRAHTSQEDTVDAADSLWTLKLLTIVESEIKAHKTLKLKCESS